MTNDQEKKALHLFYDWGQEFSFYVAVVIIAAVALGVA